MGTNRDGKFARLNLMGDVNGDDWMGVAFTCDSGSVGNWIEQNCAVYLGQADHSAGGVVSSDWGECPAYNVSNSDNNASNFRCTSSGYDNKYRPVRLKGDVDHNDQFAAAFVCKNAGSSHRAAGLQSSVEVVLGWTDVGKGYGRKGATTWGACPGSNRDVSQSQDRCVTSGADGKFHSLPTTGDVNGDDSLGLMLRARPFRFFVWPDLNLYQVLVPIDRIPAVINTGPPVNVIERSKSSKELREVAPVRRNR